MTLPNAYIRPDANTDIMTPGQDVIPTPRREPRGFGRADQLMRVRKLGATSGWELERTGTMTMGPWTLDADGRPSGLSAAVLMDGALAASLYAAAFDQSWVVTTELQLNFLTAFPPGEVILDAWTASISADHMAGASHGVLRGPGGVPYVQATGWFQRVGPYRPDHRDFVQHTSGPRLGPETEVPLGNLLSMTTPPVANTTNSVDGCPHGDTLSPAETFSTGVEFEENEDLNNPMGAIHGGILTTMAGLAAQQAMPDRLDFAFQSLRVIFLRPGSGRVASRTRVRHAGRSLRIVEVELYGRNGVTKPFIHGEAVFRANG